MVAHISAPRIWEVEAEGLGIRGYNQLPRGYNKVSPSYYVTACLNNKQTHKENGVESSAPDPCLSLMLMINHLGQV